LQQITKVITAILDAKLFGIQKKVDSIDKKIKFLPTTELYLSEQAMLIKEVKDMREEQVI